MYQQHDQILKPSQKLNRNCQLEKPDSWLDRLLAIHVAWKAAQQACKPLLVTT